VSLLPPPRPDLPPPPGGSVGFDGVMPMDPSHPPTASWRWWEILLVGFGAVVIGTFPAWAVYAGFGQSPTTSGLLGGVDFLANAVDQIVVVVVLLGYLTWRHPGWQRSVRLPSPKILPRELGIGLACGIGMTVALGILVSWILEPIFRAATDRDVTPADQIGSGIHGWSAVAFVVAVVIVAPIAEELFFRGLFYRSLRDRYGFWVGAIGSSLLFAVSHTGAGDLAQILMLQIAIGTFGVALAAIYEWRGSLGANVAAHAAFNLVTVLSVLKVI
jgi:membrane protease YdiL (CAAX protease family)